MWEQAALIAVGLLFLWKGSDFAVDAAKRLATVLGIGETIFGLTIVSVGTSLPEIFTNVYAAVQIHSGTETSGIAVGAVVGSEIIQITLVLGLAAMFGSMRPEKGALRRDGSALILAASAVIGFGLDGRISQLEGGVLIAAYIAYLWHLARSHSVGDRSEPENAEPIKVAVEVLRLAVGLAVLLVGGALVVDNATEVAAMAGISQTVIGILVIGVGTSLPELSIGIMGMRRGAAGISLGALLGSNITDPTLSLGSGAVISGFDFDPSLLQLDVPFWLGATVIALWFLRTDESLDRREGAALMGLFVVYVAIKLWMLR